MNDLILEHFNNYDFDIRKTKDARFMDQKVTPDVLCIIADCIIEFISEDNNKIFTANDIWDFDYTNQNVMDIFRKPSVDNINAENEYDKFFSQPLRMLAYAGVLKLEKKSNRNFYQIHNYKILEYISIKERNALNFIQLYLEKVLNDSNIFKFFSHFFAKQDKSSYWTLRNEYINFIIENTNINWNLEAWRIFTKVLNPLAFKYWKHWTIKWHLSKIPITLDELLYNRPNWRDIWKIKSDTREDHISKLWEDEFKWLALYNYKMNKSKKLIKRLYQLDSELQDEFANWSATQVHHIFMASEFPEISYFPENLILLTPTQHLAKAHPNNNTQIICREYQLLLIIAKSQSIEKSLKKSENYYSKEDFVYVLNTWLQSSISEELSFSEIIWEVDKIYNLS